MPKEIDGKRSISLMKIITEMRSGERSLDQYLATSVEELIKSGNFKIATVKGTENPLEQHRLQALRIIGLRDEKLDSFELTPSSVTPKTAKRLLSSMQNGLDRLPLTEHFLDLFSTLADPAINCVRVGGLQTVAGMQISRSLVTDNEIVQVYFPRVFRGIDLPIFPPEKADDVFGLSMASYFLKKVPFGKRGIRMMIPTH